MSKNFEIIFREFMNSETFVVSRELLEDYKRQAAQEERERIIKLLEQHYLETRIEADIRGQIITQSYSIDLIALIKGENK